DPGRRQGRGIAGDAIRDHDEPRWPLHDRAVRRGCGLWQAFADPLCVTRPGGRIAYSPPFMAGMRSVPLKSTITVRFVSGREEKFEVDFWGGTGTQARFKEFLDKPTIVLQLATELLVIPASAIECVSISLPKEGKLDIGTLRTAKRVK